MFGIVQRITVLPPAPGTLSLVAMRLIAGSEVEAPVEIDVFVADDAISATTQAGDWVSFYVEGQPLMVRPNTLTKVVIPTWLRTLNVEDQDMWKRAKSLERYFKAMLTGLSPECLSTNYLTEAASRIREIKRWFRVDELPVAAYVTYLPPAISQVVLERSKRAD
jgi:hypothetical protein